MGHSVGHEHDASEHERDRFAREVAKALADACRKDRFARLHVLAAPRFLGALREHMDDDTRARLAGEHDVDVTAETAEQIRSRLPEHL